MAITISLFLLAVANIIVGYLKFDNEEYKIAMINAFAAGFCLAASIHAFLQNFDIISKTN